MTSFIKQCLFSAGLAAALSSTALAQGAIESGPVSVLATVDWVRTQQNSSPGTVMIDSVTNGADFSSAYVFVKTAEAQALVRGQNLSSPQLETNFLVSNGSAGSLYQYVGPNMGGTASASAGGSATGFYTATGLFGFALAEATAVYTDSGVCEGPDGAGAIARSLASFNWISGFNGGSAYDTDCSDSDTPLEAFAWNTVAQGRAIGRMDTGDSCYIAAFASVSASVFLN